jgi:hypothetical protein
LSFTRGPERAEVGTFVGRAVRKEVIGGRCWDENADPASRRKGDRIQVRGAYKERFKHEKKISQPSSNVLSTRTPRYPLPIHPARRT